MDREKPKTTRDIQPAKYVLATEWSFNRERHRGVTTIHVHRVIRTDGGGFGIEHHPEHHGKQFTDKAEVDAYGLTHGLLKPSVMTRTAEEVREFHEALGWLKDEPGSEEPEDRAKVPTDAPAIARLLNAAGFKTSWQRTREAIRVSGSGRVTVSIDYDNTEMSKVLRDDVAELLGAELGYEVQINGDRELIVWKAGTV